MAFHFATMAMRMNDQDGFAMTVRTEVRPGDLGGIIALHGTVYAGGLGFDPGMEALVARPLAEFFLARSDRERVWIAERAGRLAGCIAIVRADEETAQLRWFVVHPDARGAGLGRTLLRDAIAFSRVAGYRRIVLWTVDSLHSAIRLYLAEGFRLAEQKPGPVWGVDVAEQRYDLDLV
ncbi:GNAT family N-acetyltransferase [Longimicrobium terrae]|nr:GNAT family N-acetyltransferase [Longimicrobium terrae]